MTRRRLRTPGKDELLLDPHRHGLAMTGGSGEAPLAERIDRGLSEDDMRGFKYHRHPGLAPLVHIEINQHGTGLLSGLQLFAGMLRVEAGRGITPSSINNGWASGGARPASLHSETGNPLGNGADFGRSHLRLPQGALGYADPSH